MLLAALNKDISHGLPALDSKTRYKWSSVVLTRLILYSRQSKKEEEEGEGKGREEEEDDEKKIKIKIKNK